MRESKGDAQSSPCQWQSQNSVYEVFVDIICW